MTFVPVVGGCTCSTSPALDALTLTGRTDGATTFDSPFPANLLAVWDWESLFARLWSGRAQFDGISGDFVLHSPLFCVREPFPAVPCQYFLAGDFLYTKFCVQSMG